MSDTRVLEFNVLAGDIVVFSDARKDPIHTVATTREVWKSLGAPLTVTVTLTAGGEFKPDDEKQVEADYSHIDGYAAARGARPYPAPPGAGAYL